MSINKLKDEELFDLVKDDSTDAFTVLYKRYWKKLMYKSLSKTNSHFDSEEVVQDTLLQIWKYRKTIVLQYQFATYIGAILAYNIMSKMADRKKFVGSPTEGIFELEVEDNSTQDNLAYTELIKELETSMSSLPEKCKLVFQMSRIDGKNHKEISKELNISTNVIKKQINKAIKILNKRITTAYYTYIKLSSFSILSYCFS